MLEYCLDEDDAVVDGLRCESPLSQFLGDEALHLVSLCNVRQKGVADVRNVMNANDALIMIPRAIWLTGWYRTDNPINICKIES